MIFQLHQILCDLSEVINSYFQLQILVIILTSFIVIVFSSYYILQILSDTSNKNPFRANFLFTFGYQLVGYAMNVTLIVTVCSKTLNSAKRLGGINHKALNKATDPRIREKLMQFSMQIVHNKPLFTAYGLFLIDGSLIFTVRKNNS